MAALAAEADDEEDEDVVVVAVVVIASEGGGGDDDTRGTWPSIGSRLLSSTACSAARLELSAFSASPMGAKGPFSFLDLLCNVCP
jgi:hypothetical protein